MSNQAQYVRKISSRGQVVLPRQLMNTLGLRAGDRVEFVEVNGTWTVRRHAPEGLFAKYIGAFKFRRYLPMDSEEFLNEVRGELPPEEGDG